MQQAEYNVDDFDPRFKNEADKNLLVKFYHKVRPKKGSPGEFAECEYIDIRPAGQHDGVARPATGADKARFPAHYAAFVARVAPPTEGTPLAEWSMMPRALVEKMAYLNLKTVEQLASIADVNIPREIAALGLKKKANDWLEAHKDDKFMDKMRTDLEQRDDRIGQLEGLVDKLTAKVNELVELNEATEG